MAFNFGIRKDFCNFLTNNGKCRKSKEKKCPYAQIPSPPENTKDKWEETLRYLESVSCPYQNSKINNWLQELINYILSKGVRI